MLHLLEISYSEFSKQCDVRQFFNLFLVQGFHFISTIGGSSPEDGQLVSFKDIADSDPKVVSVRADIFEN